MSGAYCKYCDRRCFVDREIPADGLGRYAGWSGHMATCQAGKAHDRRETGYDADTAINPYARDGAA